MKNQAKRLVKMYNNCKMKKMFLPVGFKKYVRQAIQNYRNCKKVKEIKNIEKILLSTIISFTINIHKQFFILFFIKIINVKTYIKIII